MNKKETNNREEIKKNEMGKKHPMDVNRIRDIVRFIVDSSYEFAGRYTLERHTKSLYRFCFGIAKSIDVPGMFEGKTANEAMYRAIDFELTKDLKLTSRGELTKLAEDRLAAIQNVQQKRKELEEKLVAKNTEYKKLMKERDELKKEMGTISNIIDRITNRWKDDSVMQSFEKKLASWKRPSVLIAFILENTEKLMHRLEKEELEERLREGVLATLGKNVNILETLWYDMQCSIMDGKWHAFSEANEIIMKHGYRQITIGRISQIRQAYFKFAKDEEYHTVRGGKDYIFEWKRTDGANKFRFTPVGKEVKPEKMVEKGLELGMTVDCVSDHPIRENPRDEFMRLFCDGKWHSSSEPIEMFKKYDNYKRYKQSSFLALRSSYMIHAQKIYQMIKKREGRTYKFKFEKKRVESKLIKLQNDVKCARCGQPILCGEKSHQIDNLFYHTECYEVMEV